MADVCDPVLPPIELKTAAKAATNNVLPQLNWSKPLLIILVALLSLTSVVAAQQHPTESQVKAAYLYNFGKFVRWPADRPAPPTAFEICILGKDPFGAVLDSTVAGESINGKTITVKRLSTVQEASQCRVLFISASEDARLLPALAAAQRLNILTVSDIRSFAERGGAIGLVSDQGKIRFEVNLNATEQSHLVLSSELLKVAIKVIGKPGPAS
jgi:hypothetical protein